MGLFKNLNRKKIKNKKGLDSIDVSKFMQSGNAIPFPYRHSKKFILDGINPLEDERALVKNLNLDDQIYDMRDATIESDSNDEIALIKEQYHRNINLIHHINDLQSGEIVKTTALLKLHQADLQQLEKDEAKIRGLMSTVNKY